MEPLVINHKQSDIVKISRTFLALYFFAFSAYFVFIEASINRYGILFFAATLGALLTLLIFLFNTLWVNSKKPLVINQLIVESNIPKSKFKIEWINVSKVSIYYSSVYFHVNGGRKERILDLSDVSLKDITPIKSKVEEICKHKNIVCVSK